MGHPMRFWCSETRDILGDVGATTLPESRIQSGVKQAVRKFSGDVPRTLYTDYTGNGSSYDFTLPTNWVHGFSEPDSIEYPLGRRPEQFLELDEVILYPRSRPTVLRLNETVPANGQQLRLYWTAPYPIPDDDAATDLIGETDFAPVTHLAAFFVCLEMATRAAGNKNPSLPGADMVDWKGEEARWLDVGKPHLKVYTEHIGGDDGVAPAMAVTDWNLDSSFWETGGRFLSHRRRR